MVHLLHCTRDWGKGCCWEFQRSRKRSTQKKTTQSLEKYRSKGFLKTFPFLRDSLWAITFTVHLLSLVQFHRVKLSLSLCKQLKSFLAQQRTLGHIRVHTIHCTLPLFMRRTAQCYVRERCSEAVLACTLRKDSGENVCLNNSQYCVREDQYIHCMLI